MKNLKRISWLMLSFGLHLVMVRAQNNVRGVIVRDTGIVVKGSLQEIEPVDTAINRSTEGNIFSPARIEYEKNVNKPQYISQPVKPSSIQSGGESPVSLSDKFSIYGGMAVPVGEFDNDTRHYQWYASTGYTIGMQYVSGRDVGLLVDASLTKNSATYQGIEPPYGIISNSNTWHSYHVIGGFKICLKRSGSTSLVIAPLFGLYVSSGPYLQYSFVSPRNDMWGFTKNLYFDIEVESVTSIDHAEGVMVQLELGHVAVGVRYLASNAKFKTNVSWFAYDGASAYSDTRYQGISFIQMYVGYSFY